MTISATRYHDISCGHRVYGHESKCAHLHGHNYRVHFTVEAYRGGLDSIGRVMDFSVIKSRLCAWLEETWDHKFLICTDDPLAEVLKRHDPEGVVVVQFNPTAENMARYLLHVVGPFALRSTACILTRVSVEETRKCSAASELDASYYYTQATKE